VRIKRELRARLLTTALGTQFEDRDDLFVEHTLLVNSAEIIAHAVLGLPLEAVPPAALLTGRKFDERGVYGVVESDFFDWVIEVPGGETFVRTLARRLGRFEWSDVEHDVLKVLYESVIEKETRKRLGEYYAPDWLAEAIPRASQFARCRPCVRLRDLRVPRGSAVRAGGGVGRIDDRSDR
jgi:hypothetical protein